MSDDDKAKVREAVAEVIRSLGFTNLASEYLTRPADRAAIVRIATNDLRRNHGFAKAERFALLARRAA